MAEVKRNRSRLITLLACVCVLAAVLGGLYAYRVHRIRAGFFAMRDQGLKAADAGQTSLAVNLLGNYLARYPNDTVVLAVYARNCPLVELPNNENVSRAIWALRHLLRLEPDHLDARRQLMGLYVQTGYHAEALEEADTILTARIAQDADPDANLELIALGVNPSPPGHPLSEIQIKSIRPKLVASLLKYPDALEATGVRTNSLLALHKYPEALTACGFWIDADPASLDAALIRVELLQFNHGSHDQATKLADDWSKGHSNPTDNQFLKGHTQLAFGRPDKAVDVLTAVATSNTDLSSQSAERILIADLDAIQKPELARSVLRRLIGENPKDDLVRFDLVRRDWDLGDSAHLAEVVDLSSNLQATAGIPTYVLGLRTTALMLIGKSSEAVKSLQDLANRKDDHEAAAWVILIQQSIDHHPDSMQILKACQSALDQNPRDFYIRYFLAQTYAQQGERELAIHEWQRVTIEDRSWALPAIRLSNCLLEAGRTEQALEAARVARDRLPNGSANAADLDLARAWVANIQAGHKEDADQCLAWMSDSYAMSSHAGPIIVLYSSLLATLGKTQEAAKVVEAALVAPNPLPEQSWITLASLCESKPRLSDQPLERRCLARSQKEHGITPVLAYAKAVAAADAKAGLASFDADAAAAPRQNPSTQPAISIDGQTVDPALSWDLARAGYLELVHDSSSASAWAKLADCNPSVLRVQRLVLSVQSVQADKELSARCIDRIGQLSGHDDSAWRLARARWLVAFSSFLDSDKQPTPEAVEARSLLNDLITQTPDSVENRLVSALAFELTDKLPDAISELRFASTLSPKAVYIRLSLARLLEKEGDFNAVQEQLDHLTDADLQGADHADQRCRAAEMFADQGEVERAIKLLEENSNADKESGTASLLLAQLYQRRGDLKEAHARLDKLLAGHPDSAVLRFGADLFGAEQNMEQAQIVLDRLGKDVKVEPGIAELIRADFAFRFERDPAKAISLLQAAAKVAPKNPLTWRGLTGAYLSANKPSEALDTVYAGLRAIPNDPTLAAISRRADMLTYAAKEPKLRQILQFYVNDPLDKSAATIALEAIWQDSLKKPRSEKPGKPKDDRDPLGDQLKELAAQYPRFLPLQMYLMQRYAEKAPPFDDAIAVALAAERGLPDSPELAEATTLLMRDAQRYPEDLAAAQHWRDVSPTQRTEATLEMAAALQQLKQPKEALDLLQPLFERYMKEGPRSAADDQIPGKYNEALQEVGTKPDLPLLMQDLLSRPGKDGPPGRVQWMRFAVANLPVDDAEAWLQRAGDKIPDKSSPEGVKEQVTLSEMYSALGVKSSNPRYAQKALEILQSLASVDKPQPEVLFALGARLDANNNWTDAAAKYQGVLQADPDNIPAQNNLAMDLARTGRAPEARPHIDSAIKALTDRFANHLESPIYLTNAAELQDTRAFVDSKSGNTNDAVADMQEAIRLNHSPPRYHLKLAQMLVDANRRKEAEDELKLLDSMAKTLSPEQTQQLKDLHAKITTASINVGN